MNQNRLRRATGAIWLYDQLYNTPPIALNLHFSMSEFREATGCAATDLWFLLSEMGLESSEPCVSVNPETELIEDAFLIKLAGLDWARLEKTSDEYEKCLREDSAINRRYLDLKVDLEHGTIQYKGKTPVKFSIKAKYGFLLNDLMNSPEGKLTAQYLREKLKTSSTKTAVQFNNRFYNNEFKGIKNKLREAGMKDLEMGKYVQFHAGELLWIARD